MSLQGNVSARVWEVVQSAYEAGNYTDAILDSVRYLSEVIRNKSGLESDGNALIGAAFGGHSPIVKVNPLQTESERDEQRGIEHLLRGIYTGIRNPRSHEKRIDKAETADVLISFIDYIVNLIDKSRSPFDSEQIIERVFDKHFPDIEKYSDLLVARIPQRKRLDIAIQIFQRRTQGNWRNLTLFTKALLKTLGPDEQQSYWQVISDSLEEASSDPEFRSAIQLARDNWLEISEIARLRTEHRLVKSVKEGEYDSEKRSSLSGSLGTWASGDLAKSFILRDELIDAIVDRLCSDNARAQAYGFHFFWETLRVISPEPPVQLVWTLENRLTEQDSTAYEWLGGIIEYGDEDDLWVKEFKNSYENFQPPHFIDPDAVGDEDIPY